MLKVGVADGIATLTLDRPEARNALSLALMGELESALATSAADPDIRVVVLAGNGPAFCAGHDLKELRALEGRNALAEVFTLCTRMMTAIRRHPRPVIAKVHGTATAAGCQLVASCDLAYAAEEARFATPGVNIGLFCSTPMVALSRALAPKHALEMLLSGEAVDAATAAAWGLVSRAVPAADLDRVVAETAARLATKSPHALRLGKDAFYRQQGMPLDEAYAFAARLMTENMLAEDAAEGIDAFLARRPPRWRGE
jgi:enoyl-CoA hydratase/carnithine racemase